VLTPKSILARFEKRKNEIERAIVCESARWGDAQAGTGGFMAPPRVTADGKEETGPLTKEDWSRETQRLLDHYFPKRTSAVLGQLWNIGLWPDTEPVTFSQHGGLVLQGSKVQMNAQRGKIYYTLDSSDPRLAGGKLSPKAKAYDSPVAVDGNVVAKARVLLENDWSPLTEAEFKVGAQ
jgi:hypothetical protein